MPKNPIKPTAKPKSKSAAQPGKPARLKPPLKANPKAPATSSTKAMKTAIAETAAATMTQKVSAKPPTAAVAPLSAPVVAAPGAPAAPALPPAPEGFVNVFVDGALLQVKKGSTVMAACTQAGKEIPHFCY